MIKVLIKREENKIVSLEVKGHAKSAEQGKDLVCAGVTSILAGGFNNLENPESFELKLEEGYACAKALKEVSSHDEIVLETIVTSLKTMEESWPQFINIKNF